MRRKEREITDRAVMEEIIQGTEVCRMGLCDGGTPYVVPMNFGYQDGKVYMHSAVEGRKLDTIRKNPEARPFFKVDLKMESGPQACFFCHEIQTRHGLGEGLNPGGA